MFYLHAKGHPYYLGHAYKDPMVAYQVCNMWNTFTPETCDHKATSCDICKNIYVVTPVDKNNMSILTHSRIPKFAFIGTSSSGKTTATYQTCAYLKLHGIRVDGILQQDRRLPFDPALLETHAEAQNWFLANMMVAESYMSLQKGTDAIVSDRSVLDFLAYAITQWPYAYQEWFTFVQAWITTYNTIYYLPPRVYDNDGVRPPDQFRLAVDQTLLKLMNHPNIIGRVKFVTSAEDAMRDIALKTKRAVLGYAGNEDCAHLTGSWSKGIEKPGSDFDFIMTTDNWLRVDEQVRNKFTMVDAQPFRERYDDPGLLMIWRSSYYNMDIQIQSAEFLERRLTKNKLEQIECEKQHATQS